MTAVRIEIAGHPGPRLYIRDRRWHHGRTGECLIAAGLIASALGQPAIGTAFIATGAALCAHDIHDWPWPTVER